MNINNLSILSLLIFANASLIAACSIALMRFSQQARRFEKFWDSPLGSAIADTQALQAQAAAQSTIPAADAELEKRVAELQAVVRTLAAKGQPEQHAVDNKLPIENAVRMAQGGASIDDLIRNCGLNIGEAQLMRKLHGRSRAATPGARASA